MSSSEPVLMVVDDEPGMLSLVERAVRTTGFRTILCSSASEALQRLPSDRADVALVDLRMPEIGGLDVLRAIRQAQPQCGVILMTAHASVDTAIEAVKLGALDYLTKPLDFERLRQLLTGVEEEARRRAELLEADNATAHRLELCGMIGRSAVMQELFGLVKRIAPHARTALVTGETGAGKEGIARAIHQYGPRKNKKFVTINCSAVVETLFESELFGHARGAFTGATEHKAGLFEAADGGTLFLDEVGELPAAVQAKLLRVLETGEVQRVGSLQPKKVDVRVVAATNRDLRRESENGSFRRDLFYRLNLVELDVPPLRERREDIPYLVAAFVREFADRFEKPIERVSPAAERLLIYASWPGNVRELRNVLERACMLAEGFSLSEADIARCMPVESSQAAPPPAAATRDSGADLETVERDHIIEVLRAERGNKVAAARRLGISRRTLYRRLERHGLLTPGVPAPGSGL
ncbi:MAG TPA: sigma-54 dependent transcriptional regulator [Vicinamibacterales bacterium]|nr:sigma-54 dependent transcriptional regulator [Vicinamibacterales bacterium]